MEITLAPLPREDHVLEPFHTALKDYAKENGGY